MFKRTLSLLAVIVLLLTVFAACGKEPVTSSDPQTDSSPDVSASVSDIPDASDVSDVPQGDVNSDNSDTGNTTASGNSGVTTTKTTKKNTASDVKANYSMPLSKPVTFSVFLTEHTSQPIKTDSIKWAAVKEKTNVTLDVDIATGTTAKTKLAAASASGTMYDIASLSHTTLKTLKTKLFVDLTDVIKTKTPNYYKLVKDDLKDMSIYSIGGKIYGFGMFVNESMDEAYTTKPIVYGMRKDILDDENLKVPSTWDEWFDVMKKLKAKYPDSTPFSGRSKVYILDYWTDALCGLTYKVSYNTKTDKYECGVLSSNFYSALQFMKQCYDVGILDKNFNTTTAATFQEGASSNKIFFWMDNAVIGVAPEEILKQSNPDAGFTNVPLMSSKFNGNKKSGKSFDQLANYANMYCLGAATQNREELLAFMDWCYTEEGMLTTNCGKKGTTYELNKDGTPYFPEKVWKKYGEQSMPEYALMSDLGLGQLCFAPRVLSTWAIEWKNREVEEEEDDAAVVYGADIKAGCYSAVLTVSPDVDSTMLNRYNNINSYIESEVIRFIKGDRALSEWNAFQAELQKLGIKDIINACNK